ncbi:hypothetical protein H181DRAFT_05504 [Streptomyces sp. WMMB 714]|uniref:hypothetical protein n=1 Tax=Streptomyces sp. WMMB 714 TaxID=1286822 RepID=UPI0005F7E202|nr:hypothetical protein [Streptomyces sp. WMMB 714]SCK58033.1 hypothetical protein H181DRAFT_05504 [Streptomyces sp. WMMB 714]
MGIESDQLVFDYLSRIGDLAHSTSMTAAERARLVNGLRGEIDRMRAEQGGAESKAAVRKILSRLGRPEDVVTGAGGSVPAPRGGTSGGGSSGSDRYGGDRYGGGAGTGGGTGSDEPKVSLWKRGTSRRGLPDEPSAPAVPPVTAARGASAPHLAGIDELGPEESNPDWWRIDPSPYGDGGGRTFGKPVPGFVGGIEIPELLKPPPGPGEEGGRGKDGAGAAVPGGREPGIPVDMVKDAGGGAAAAAGAAGRLRGLWRGRAAPGGQGGPRAGGIVEWTAALLLVAGAVAGSLIPLAVGWLAAWWSPRLSRMEAKWAAAGMPALVAGGAVVWVWGRIDGRWGERIPQGGDALGQALVGAWPVLLKIAAVASALFLAWRARRPRG